MRQVAAGLLASSNDGPALDRLFVLLAHEQQPSVRKAAIEGLARRGSDAQANDAVVRALVEGLEPDPTVRAQMVAYLSQQFGAFPKNRDALQERLKRETDRQVAIAILNSLAR